MTWKCCVPRCKTSSSLPCHRIPKQKCKEWLTAIGKLDDFSSE